MSSLLPERPSLEQYKNQAKDLLSAALSGEAQALDTFRRFHPAALSKPTLRLSDAQHAVARSLDFASWPKLRSAIQAREIEAFFADVEKADEEAVGKWLKSNPTLARAVNSEGATALHVAAGHNDAGIAKMLLKGGADPAQVYGQSAHTALSWAVTVGCFDVARELVDAGQKPDLFCAAGIGDMDLIKSFWPNGHLIDQPSKTGSSRFAEDGSRLPRPPESDQEQVSDALYIAARQGRANAVRWLVDCGADVNFRAYLGGTPLHWGEFSGNDEVTAILRQNGASDEVRDHAYDATPRAFGIVAPASWGLVHILIRRLERNPTLANVTGAKWTPLQAAAHEGQAGCVQVLLACGADKSARTLDGNTALDLARKQNHQGVVQLLTV